MNPGTKIFLKLAFWNGVVGVFLYAFIRKSGGWGWIILSCIGWGLLWATWRDMTSTALNFKGIFSFNWIFASTFSFIGSLFSSYLSQ